MHEGYNWPVCGDRDEVCFIYTYSRTHRHVDRILSDKFSGTIVSNGYIRPIASFAQSVTLEGSKKLYSKNMSDCV